MLQQIQARYNKFRHATTNSDTSQQIQARYNKFRHATTNSDTSQQIQARYNKYRHVTLHILCFLSTRPFSMVNSSYCSLVD
jgi:hypothetical protein